MRKKIIPLLSLIVLLATTPLLSGCSTKTAAGADTTGLAMASMEGMPENVKSAPATVQQAYQFAVANPDTLKQIPCYCGCGAMGHTSNYSCYVTGVDQQGKITFDDHALGCSICVDITQDVMRLQKDKKTIQEIRTYIDNTYSKYGPSNISGSNGPVVPVSNSTNMQGVCSTDGSQPCPVK